MNRMDIGDVSVVQFHNNINFDVPGSESMSGSTTTSLVGALLLFSPLFSSFFKLLLFFSLSPSRCRHDDVEWLE
jgi:hypothetical protein